MAKNSHLGQKKQQKIPSVILRMKLSLNSPAFNNSFGEAASILCLSQASMAGKTKMLVTHQKLLPQECSHLQ